MISKPYFNYRITMPDFDKDKPRNRKFGKLAARKYNQNSEKNKNVSKEY